jgi:hypothetical protein
MKRIAQSLILLLFVISGYSQTATVLIDFTSQGNGIGLCTSTGALSDDGQYDCILTGQTNFYSGMDEYTFMDPVPPGNQIVGISITFYGTCAGTADIEIASIPTFPLNLASTGTCNGQNNACIATVANYVGLVPEEEYNYEGMNTFDLINVNGTEGGICIQVAEIEFTYEAIPPIPTLTTWSIIVLGLLFLISGIILIKFLSMKNAL